MTYYDDLGIKLWDIPNFKMERVKNRIILTDKCKNCNFKTNFIITIYSNVDHSDFIKVIDLSTQEIEQLDSEIKIKTDSLVTNEAYVNSIVYKFSRNKIDLIGMAKLIYSKKLNRIVTINCIVSEEEYAINNNNIKAFFERASLY